MAMSSLSAFRQMMKSFWAKFGQNLSGRSHNKQDTNDACHGTNNTIKTTLPIKMLNVRQLPTTLEYPYYIIKVCHMVTNIILFIYLNQQLVRNELEQEQEGLPHPLHSLLPFVHNLLKNFWL